MISHQNSPNNARPSPAHEASPSLCDLLRQSAAGNRDAFARFYDATAAKVYALALLKTRDQRKAEATTRAVYQQAWREAGRQAANDCATSPLTWLLALTSRIGATSLPASA